MHKVVFSVLVLATVTGCVTTQPARHQAASGDIRDQWDVRISKAELVFPNASPSEVADGIKDALSQFAIPANLSYHAMPSSPPVRPGAPELKRVSSAVPSPEYVCEGSYAEIAKRPPPVQNAFAFISEGHQVCLYSFSRGVKAYVMYYSIKKLESLTSGLFNGITRAIRGTDEERAKSQLTDNIDEIRAKLPTVLVERVEIPGTPAETPDLAAVTALIPAAEAVSIHSDPRAIASMPDAAQSPRLGKVEARKNLHEMGLMYHSQAQFVEAIKRNDELAVELFMSAGAVSLETAGKDGKTPLQLSKNAKIIALLEGKQSEAVPAPSPAAELPSLQAAYINAPSVDFTKIPADFLADIDEEVAKTNLTDEQKLMMRTKLAQQYLQMRRLADAIKQ
jgi:hypothetical protein